MRLDTWDRIDALLLRHPILRGTCVPTRDEITIASDRIGIRFDEDYISFVLRYGGAIIGELPVFGLRPVEPMGEMWCVVDVTNRYRSQGIDGTEDWYIVSEDLAGNPIGMAADGTVWTSDHEFGGVFLIATDFESFIRHRCLHLDGTS